MTDRSDPEAVEVERRRSRRSVRFILAIVAATVVLLVSLALWVAVVPYEASARLGERDLACDAFVESEGPDPDITAWVEDCGRAEDEARSRRRETAVVIGAVGVVVALTVSTWPSRRLTGERLGPLPDELSDHDPDAS